MGYREKVITLGCMDWDCCLQVPIRTALLPKNEPAHALIVIGHHMDVYINGEVLWNGTNVPYMKLFDWSNFDFENAWDDSFRLELFSDGLARNMKNYAFDGAQMQRPRDFLLLKPAIERVGLWSRNRLFLFFMRDRAFQRKK